MKTISFIFIILFSITLASCGGGFNNFNSQKYTGLKSLPTAYQAQEKEEKKTGESPILKVVKTLEKVDVTQIDSPESDALKKAIAEEEAIVVKKGDNYYLVEEPLYDQFYNALHGKMTEVKKEDLSQNWFQLEVPESQNVFNRNGISISSEVKITQESSRSTSKTESVIDDSKDVDLVQLKPERKAFRIYISKKDWNLTSKKDVMKSKYGRNTRAASGSAAVLLMIAIFSMILFAFLWVDFFLIIFVVGFLASLISFLVAAVNARKFTREMYYQKKRLHNAFKGLKFAIWLGILLTTYIFFPIAILITMAS